MQNIKTIKNERIKWIDQAKGIGLFFVMLGHTYLDEKYIFWFTSFHMALFFFLSGCTFQYYEDWRGFIKKKIIGLLVPYCTFSIIIVLYNYILAILYENKYNLFSNILSYILQIRHTHLWFLTCLFFSEIVFYIIYDKFLKHRKIGIIYFFVAICGVVIEFIYRYFININLIWNIDLVPLGVSFMTIGYIYKQIENKTINVILWITIIFTFLGSAIANFTINGKVDWWANSFGNPILFILSSIFGTLFIILICKSISINLFIFFGKNTILWYGLHRIVIDLIFVIYNKIGINMIYGSIESFIFAIISVILTIIALIPVNYIALKWCPYLLGKRTLKINKLNY